MFWRCFSIHFVFGFYFCFCLWENRHDRSCCSYLAKNLYFLLVFLLLCPLIVYLWPTLQFSAQWDHWMHEKFNQKYYIYFLGKQNQDILAVSVAITFLTHIVASINEYFLWKYSSTVYCDQIDSPREDFPRNKLTKTHFSSNFPLFWTKSNGNPLI